MTPFLTSLTRQLAHLVAVLLLVTMAGTALISLMPSEPAIAILGPTATDEQIAEFNAEHGYDQPLPVQYVQWLGGALTGDLGNSIHSGEPVVDTLLDRLPVTLQLTVLALLLSLAVAVPLAFAAASRENTVLDRVLSRTASGVLSIPIFVLGVLLVYVFAVTSGLFPVAGWAPMSAGLGENLRYVALPVLALALAEFPAFYRLLRSDVISTLNTDFIRTATVRGLPRWYIMLRHVLRPSSLPLITVAAVTFGRLLAGSVVVESLFGLPGLGNLALQSVPSQDIPMIQGIVVLVAITYVLINTAVDRSYSILDPRMRA
ncbi:peptide/nickel transport system permease protein [Lipingzhangella halophila]|uniref:Peptide/nickel transport system permease protein n=1 Tax=Lipingzhangella halophila TaxID=1783352 RepID=A0A7W7RJ97_9ACTN|nr:ABC transporter permease [Lipingzhangella halophila]MBB4932887.1 peptide/nickel transport system permease protein [Lipingzhangella halophila]